MNKTFRSIWSEARQAHVAVAENVAARGRPGATVRLASVSAVVLGLLLAGPVQSQAPPPPGTLPQGGSVSAGSAHISQAGAAMVIQQSTDRASIQWQSFDVGSAAHVDFRQPNAHSVTLNRVLSADPSHIFGRITANGQVILTNPQGIYFGRDARVDVGGLIASTHSLSDADFMAGQSRFERKASTGRVVNEGELKAALGGYIALLAPEVRNQGTIMAQMGTVALAAGELIELQFDHSNRLTRLRVEPSLIQSLVDNRQAVQAPGGLIILSAPSLDRLMGGVVRNSGRLEAHGMQQQGGRIVLSASMRVENHGLIAANAGSGSAPAAGGPAGRIEMAAPEVHNAGTLSATGDALHAAGALRVEATAFTQVESGQITLSAPERGGIVSIEARGEVHIQGAVTVAATQDAAADSPSQGGRIEVVSESDIRLHQAQLDAGGGQGGSIHLRAAGQTQPALPQPPADQPGRGQLAIGGHSTLSTRGLGGRGGETRLLGDHIHLADGVTVDASGSSGGGSVLVGGDWQGASGTYQATTLTMDAGALVDASARQRGQGGTVVLWSDVHKPSSNTAVHGAVLARGGVLGGDGGRVETSGHAVDIQGLRVNAGADQGTGGLWLIDPYNYTIDATAAAAIVGNVSSGLNSGTSVTVTTSTSTTSYGASASATDAGDIDLNASISKTLGGDATLTLRAARDIRMAAGVAITSTSNKLNLVLIADDDNSGNGSLTVGGVASRSSITTNGGHVWMGGNSAGTASGSSTWNGLTVGTGAASSGAGTGAVAGIELRNVGITTGGGHLSLTGRSERYIAAEDRTGVAILSATDIHTGAGNLTVRGDLPANPGAVTSGVLYGVHLNASTLQASTGAISVTGGESSSDVSASVGGYGVQLYNSTVRTTGSSGGDITIAGTTGAHSASNNIRVGVSLQAYGNSASTLVSTVAGGISITGTSNNTSTNQSGVRLVTGKAVHEDSNHPVVNVVSTSGAIGITGALPLAATDSQRGLFFDGSNFGKMSIGFDGITAYSGAITLSGRSVADANFKAGYLTVGGSGSLAFSLGSSSDWGGVITGSGNVVKSGAGLLNVSGVNTYTGATSISTGILKLGHASALGSSSNVVVASGAALDLAGFSPGALPLTLSGSGVSSSGALYNSSTTATSLTYSGAITLAADASIHGGTAALTLSGAINGAFALSIATSNANFVQSGVVGGTTALTGYTVNNGSGTNTVILNSAITVAGPLQITSSDSISVLAHITGTTSGSTITLKSGGDISQAGGVAVSTQGAAVTYWSDSDSLGSGRIQFNAGTAGSHTRILTNGGHIVLGGGSAGPLNGYALAINTSSFGVNLDGFATLSAGTGDISVRGSSAHIGAGGYGIGVRLYNTIALSGRNITIDGRGSQSAGTAGYHWGVGIEAGSSVTASGDLTIEGQGGGGASSGRDNFGIVISASSVIGSGSGAVTLRGTGGGRAVSGGIDNDGIVLRNPSALRSGAGSLTLVGTAGFGNSSEGISMIPSGTNTLGSATDQSGAITLRANSFSISTAASN